MRLVFAFIFTFLGMDLIFQYGNNCAKVGRKIGHRNSDWTVIVACIDLLIAGMNIARFFLER